MTVNDAEANNHVMQDEYEDISEESADFLYDQFTVMDENTPLPIEIDSEDTFEMPEIQTMTEYIRLHYEQRMVDDLSRSLRIGETGVLIGRRVYHAFSEADTTSAQPDSDSFEEKAVDWNDRRFSSQGYRNAHIYPGKGKIVWVDLWRVSLSCFEADVTIEINVDVEWRGLRKALKAKYYVTMCFDMEDGFAVDWGFFNFCRRKHTKDEIKMDQYAIPILDWDGVEKEAEYCIMEVLGCMPNDPGQIKERVFLNRLGLQVVNLPLYKRGNTSSILFFESGEILTAEDDKDEPVSVTVEANTIVLNSRHGVKQRTAVFHECFHYMEHKMFYMLQRMHNNDIAQLGRWKPVTVKKEKRSPIEWLEWQARLGSQCLQLPRGLLRSCVEEELRTILGAHMGVKLERIGKYLAREFAVCNYQVRNRMIQIGYPEARGSLNYVDTGYIEPFCFNRDECHRGQTFVISPKELLKEYARNEDFRRIIDTGNYIYADGHACINSPEYVVKECGKLKLTQWANQNVDKCCLRFSRVYHRDKETHYVVGRLNSDDEYNSKSLAFCISNRFDDAIRKAEEIAQLLQDLPNGFGGTLKAHMKRQKVSVEKLAEMAHLSVSTVERFRSGKCETYALDKVAAICVALHLPEEYSSDLMRKAGLDNIMTPNALMIRAAVKTLYEMDIDTFTDTLTRAGCKLKLSE